MGARGAVEQLVVAFTEAFQPFGGCADATAGGLGRLLDRPTLLEHAPTDQQAGARTGLMVTVELHPVSSLELRASDTPSLQGGPDEQRL
jgi:hypothetical protein